MGEDFRERYKYTLPNNPKIERQARYTPEKYTAPRGTAEKKNKVKRRMNMRLAALILAGAIGIGGIGGAIYVKAKNSEPVTTITKLQESNIDLQSFGLSADTLEELQKYDKIFEEFDSKNAYDLTEGKVISMIGNIKDLHFSVVKEKIADLRNVKPTDVKMYYNTDKDNGAESATVIINEDLYNGREVYSYDTSTLGGLKKENTIPNELADVILQLKELDKLEAEVEKDKISKVNAVKKLEKLYENLEQIAIGDFVIDEKGNISIIQYENSKEQKEQSDDEERE